MILAFWLECFLDFHRKVEKSDLSVRQKGEVMIWFVN